MANTLISGLTELTTAPAASDWIEIETSSGVSKKIKLSTLFSYRSNVGRFGMGFSVPSTALALDGSTVSRTTYADLWAYVNANYSPILKTAWTAGAVGNFHQGDGSTTFGLPDFRGLFPRFAGTNGVMKLANAVTFFNGGNVSSVANDIMFLHDHELRGSVTVSTGSSATGISAAAATGYFSGSPHNAGSGVPRTGGENAPARVSLIPYVYFAD